MGMWSKVIRRFTKQDTENEAEAFIKNESKPEQHEKPLPLTMIQEVTGRLAWEAKHLAGLDADGLNNQGISFYELARTNDALTAFRKALEYDGNHPQAIYNLVLLEWRSRGLVCQGLMQRLNTVVGHSKADRDLLGRLRSQIEQEICKKTSMGMSGDSAEKFGSPIDDLISSVLEGHTDLLSTICLSPDGKRALSGGQDRTIRYWDLEQEKCLNVLEGHDNIVLSVCFSPDGYRALSGGGDTLLHYWDLARGARLDSSNLVCDYISHVFISPDDSHAIVASLAEFRKYSLHYIDLIKSGPGGFTDCDGHTRSLSGVALSPDGRRALTAGGRKYRDDEDYSLRYWDLKEGKGLAVLEGHNDWLNSVCFSPDGRRALSGSDDESIRYWDLENGECLAVLLGHKRDVNTVCFSPDGRRALSGSDDESIRYWDLESGECLAVLLGHKRDVNTVCFSPDGRRALSGSDDKSIRYWDLEKGECLAVMNGHSGYVTHLLVSPDGYRALSICTQSVGGEDNTIRYWNLQAAEAVRQPLEAAQTKGEIESTLKLDMAKVPLNQIDKLIRGDNKIQAYKTLMEIWLDQRLISDQIGLTVYKHLYHPKAAGNVALVIQKALLEGHKSDIECFSISPDGCRALSGGKDRSIRYWDLDKGECLAELKGHKHVISALSFSPDGRTALSGDWRGNLIYWNLKSCEILIATKGQREGIGSLSISLDGRYALSGGNFQDGTIQYWNLETMESMEVLKGHSSGTIYVTFSPDGRRALSGSAGDGSFRYWDLSSGNGLILHDGSTSVASVAILPDGRRALTGGGRDLRVWDLLSKECLAVLRGHNAAILSTDISEDGKYAISGSADSTIRIWDLEKMECLSVVGAHDDWVRGVCLSPNGSCILSVGAEQALKQWQVVWDLDAGLSDKLL